MHLVLRIAWIGALAALLVPAAIALAGTTTYGGRIALTAAYYTDEAETEAHYEGRVSSRRGACERGRTIKIFGAALKGKYNKIGEATTDARGRWEKNIPTGPKRKIVAVNLRVPEKKLDANQACTKLSTF